MRLFINFTAFGKIPAEVSGSADVATRLGKKGSPVKDGTAGLGYHTRILPQGLE